MWSWGERCFSIDSTTSVRAVGVYEGNYGLSSMPYLLRIIEKDYYIDRGLGKGGFTETTIRGLTERWARKARL
jgi:hypothetical protein